MRIAWAMLVSALAGAGMFCPEAAAGTYELSSGQTLIGEPIAPDREGVVIKMGATTFSPRIAWTNFTEKSLRTLAQDNAETRSFVANLIYEEPDIEEPVVARPEVRIQPVPRIAPPQEGRGLLALFSSPVGIFLFVALYAANIYAGYIIGVFRSFNPILVAGVSAVLPMIGPLVFLVLPSGSGQGTGELEEEEELEEAEQAYAEQAASPPAIDEESDIPVAQADVPKSVVYERGQFTFNRRFFETKLASFLRVVPSEEDKDLVLEIDSLRGHHVGNRVTKILPGELHLQVTKGDASADVALPFAEIKSVTIRHKDR